MFNGKNLLHIHESAENKYVTSLTHLLFTEKELIESYVYEGKSCSRYKQLDLERVNLIRQAWVAKWKIKPENEEQKWSGEKGLKFCIGRVCIDRRKKETLRLEKEKINAIINASLHSDE